MQEISLYTSINEIVPDRNESLMVFFNYVKSGRWKEAILDLRALSKKDKKKGEIEKLKLPGVTISGTFTQRGKDYLIEHSGLICIDLDNINVDEVRKQMGADPFVHACFLSCRGSGLAVPIKINPNKHLEAFNALEVYFREEYGILIDSKCKDISRFRFITYDPDLYHNPDSKKWTKTLKKKVQKISQVVSGTRDIDYVVQQIQDRKIDITQSDYQIYLDIGFALTEELGDSARDAYHQISIFSPKYDHDKCNKQFDHCLKHQGRGINISTFFHYAKIAGLDIITKETKTIVALAMQHKRTGMEPASTVKVIKQFYPQLHDHETSVIVGKAFNHQFTISKDDDLSMTEQIVLLLTSNYNLRKNVISRHVETGSNNLDDYLLNGIWRRIRIAIDDKIRHSDVERIINSDITPIYNPLIDFIEQNKGRKPSGNLKKLANCITTDTGMGDDNFNPMYAQDFITKWYLGLISSIYGKHSVLVLVLTGKQKSGKTEWFRRLFPDKLWRYYAEIKLKGTKDDEILMCQKLLIMDDEFGSEDLNDSSKMKRLTSKHEFTLREPYGHHSVILRRLALLGGTSNEHLVLNDPTGNRRVIPVNVLKIAFDEYNSIDKTDLLIEAYHMYQAGMSPELSGKEVETLNYNTTEFEAVNAEAELIMRVFKIPSGEPFHETMTSMDLVVTIQGATNMHGLKPNKIGLEMGRLGFKKKSIRDGDKTSKKWMVIVRKFVSSESNHSE